MCIPTNVTYLVYVLYISKALTIDFKASESKMKNIIRRLKDDCAHYRKVSEDT